MAKKRNPLLTLIPLGISLVLFILGALPGFRTADYGIYDIFLQLKPSIPEQQELLLLEIDDLAIAQVGTWPWPRDVMADGLVLLTEFDLKTLVFDIEYVDQSPRGVNSSILEQELPRSFSQGFGDFAAVVTELVDAIAQGFIRPEEAGDFIGQVEDIGSEIRDLLLKEVQAVAQDNDDYLGKSMAFFGNAWITVNMLPVEEELIRVTQEVRDFTAQQIALKNLDVSEDFVPSSTRAAVQPAILPLLRRAAGAGFPNVVVDDDGVRRRIDILAQSGDQLYGQLAFAPLLDYLGNPRVIATRSLITLAGAQFPNGEIRNVQIPLTPEGHMLIHWPAKVFAESFRHLSFNDLVVHDILEANIVRNLEIMGAVGYLDYLQNDFPLLELYAYGQDLRNQIFDSIGPETNGLDIPEDLRQEYREIRSLFFADLNTLVEGSVERAILTDIDRLLARDDLPEELLFEYTAVREEVVGNFDSLKIDTTELFRIRERLSQQVPGSFAILGQTGISTTDIGVNPFEKQFMNVGTHAAVANTILQDDFLVSLPWWVGSIMGIVLALGINLVTQNLAPIPGIAVGFGFLALVSGINFAIFTFTGIYNPTLVPLLSVLLTNIIITLINFLKAEGDKSFLRNAFGRYLSAEVIKQIVDNPDMLNLGGEKKELTAIFTDVKGFSTISEVLDPTDLVALLNRYLTGMSDIILEELGTIDKYEGDAIIAFFGAPIEFADHAARACRGAIGMKKLEIALNKDFLSENLAPSPLLTRIGINTGEMVVGNMGTPKKMDYTIMGSAVNLAARLEGVNKQYGTWILISEGTQRKAGNEFLTRKLDRVRVVGIQTPVRLYELLDHRAQAPKAQIELVDQFHQGLELFEAKEWSEAKAIFDTLRKEFPNDGPTQTFQKRCVEYQAKAPAAAWDGVFNLTSK
ncbi:MAG: CHASE2 domain-containing protein [Spirochaetales bacterium]|nr:CHASE2 domain-containing protein [Spirochaetales bacterium]